eukprot:COSAG06_NODE_2164_length_7436_cov_5.989778_4_plen_153_part_00
MVLTIAGNGVLLVCLTAFACLVTLTCLPAVASLSIYTILSRYTLCYASSRSATPAVTLSPARTLLEQRPLSPDVTASLPWSAADQFAAAGVPSRSPPQYCRQSRHTYHPSMISYPVANFVAVKNPIYREEDTYAREGSPGRSKAETSASWAN